MRILIISDDQIFSTKLAQSLTQCSYAVDTTDLLHQNEYWTQSTDYDLIIIEHSQNDYLLEISRSLRKRGKNMPLLVITESLTSNEAVQLFESGIDDYTSKFTTFSEIVLRTKALLRRTGSYYQNKIQIDDLTLDCNNFTVKRGDKMVHLTKKEFSLLEYLLRHQNQVLSRTDLIEHVWDINADLFSNSLETHMVNLRKKIELPNKHKLIHTISGRGYKIAVPS